MRQKQAAWILAGVVFGLVAFGAWKWSNRRAVERTVDVFLQAMIQGDGETLLEHLDGPALEAYLAKTPQEQKAFTAPIKGAKTEIREVHLNGATAKVRVLWKVSGFDIWSDLEVAKSSTGYWKITEIHQPDMNPTWEQVRKRLREDSSRAQTHQVLNEKLQDRQGVEVRPLTAAELDR